METTADEKLQLSWHELMFAVRKSCRYHSARRSFYDMLGFWNGFIAIIFGGTTVFSIVGNSELSKVFLGFGGAIVAIFSTIDILVGFTKRSREYHDCEKQFCELEKEMIGVGACPTEAELIRCAQKRLDIEEDEPVPHMKALDLICHNELIRSADGDRNETVYLTLKHRMLRHLVSYDGDTFEKLGEVEARRKLTLSGVASSQVKP